MNKYKTANNPYNDAKLSNDSAILLKKNSSINSSIGFRSKKVLRTESIYTSAHRPFSSKPSQSDLVVS